MAESVGTAYLTLVPKMKQGWESDVGKGMDKGGKSAGGKFGNGFLGKAAGMLKNVLPVAAIAGVAAKAGQFAAQSFAQAFNGAADREQLVGGIEKLFGDAAGIVQQNAAQAFQTVGMSANEYMENVTNFSAALTNSLGGDTVAAAAQADKAMRLVADNVSIFGSDISSVNNAIQGFAKQNYTMLDNLKLGYGGTASEMQRLVDDANDYAKSMGMAGDLSMDSFSDIITAIDLIQQKQGIAGNQAREAASTVSGSLAMLKSAWSDLLTGMGDPNADMSALFSNLSTSIEAVVRNVLPLVGRIIVNFVTNLPSLIVSALGGLGSALLELGRNAVSQMWEGIKSAVGKNPIADSFLKPFIGMVQQAQEFIQGKLMPALQTIGQGIATTVKPAFDALKGAVDNLWQAFQANILPVLQTIWSFIMANIVPVLTATLIPVIKAVGTVVGAVVSAVVTVIGGIINVLATVIGAVGSFVGKVADFFTNLVERTRANWEAIKEAIYRPIQRVWELIKPIIDKISSALSGIGSALGGINGGSGLDLGLHASGGIATTAHFIGEAGPEAIMPLRGHYMKPFAQAVADNMGGGHGDIYIDGAIVNQDEAIESAFVGFMSEIARVKRMGVA